MTFADTLTLHLAAVRGRDLEALRKTLAPSGDLTLVMADGSLKRTVAEFVSFHESWFKDPDWAIEHEVLTQQEGNDLGHALLRSRYKDVDRDGKPYEMTLLVSLLFRRAAAGWILIHDQNTALKG